MRKQGRIHAGQHSYTDPLVLCQWCLQLNWKAKIWKPSGQNKILALCVSMSTFLQCVKPGSDNMHMSWLSCQRVERMVVEWPLPCKIILKRDTFIPYSHIMNVNHLTKKTDKTHNHQYHDSPNKNIKKCKVSTVNIYPVTGLRFWSDN